MALTSRLSSGGSASSRSTKIYTGSTNCKVGAETTTFEFAGGGKLNKMLVALNATLGTGGYVRILVDDEELYKYTGGTSSSSSLYLYRFHNGELAMGTTYDDPTLPLDIEFKHNFKIIIYSANNAPKATYTVEIARD